MGQWNVYESWLGLSLGGRAPSHYELLGLPAGAPQPAALRQAVLQRMAKVRPYQTGKHGEEATRLLNELAEAAVVLGDPRRRAAYDASLAGQKLTQEQASALEAGDWWESGGSLVDPFLEQLVGEMQQQTSPLLAPPVKRRPAWYWPVVGGAGVAGLLLLVLVVASLGGGDKAGVPVRDLQRPEIPTPNFANPSRFHPRIAPLEDSTWIIPPGRLGGVDWNYWMDGGDVVSDPLQTGVGRTPFLDGQINAVSGGTPWPTRRLQTSLRFRLPSLVQRRVVLCVLYDSNLRIAVNGRNMLGCPGAAFTYLEIELTREEQAALREGENEIVASCEGDGLAEYPDVFDLGLRLVEEEDSSDVSFAPQRPPLLAYPATPAECQTAQQQWAEFLEWPVEFRSGVAGLELALIPAGQFWMGSPDWETGRNPVDERAVSVLLTRPFYLGTTEVTREQWQAVTGSFRASWERDNGTSSWPATHVNWGDAQAFCDRLNERERNAGNLPAGWTYRLPTDAQWEFACRAGSVAPFCSGDNIPTLRKFAFSPDGYRTGLQDVALLQSNAYGLFDMHGNAQEWCLDWHIGDLRGGLDPVLLERSGAAGRVVRGGRAGAPALHGRSATRAWGPPETIDMQTGFRVALVPDEMAIPGVTLAMIPVLPPLTPAQTADANRTCAELADDPAHSRWLIRPGELGGAEWSYRFGEETATVPGRTPFASLAAIGQTTWNAMVLRAWINEVNVPALATQRLVLRVRHGGSLVVQVNNRDLLSVEGGSAGYVDRLLTLEQQALFQPGQNGIAISCFESPAAGDGHFFDLGLRLVPEAFAADYGDSPPPPVPPEPPPPPVPEPAAEVTYLSDLEFVDPDNSHGHIERDRSNGEEAPADGGRLTLNGVPYAKGLGVHAPSSVTFNLNGEYDRFQAFVGLDDEARSAGSVGSVVFRVYGDGMPLADSGLLGPQSETHHIDVSVQGVQQMRLEVTDGGDNTRYDHADWADAKLLRAAPLH